MEQVKLRELHTAARVADALVWAAGGAGVLAGGVLLIVVVVVVAYFVFREGVSDFQESSDERSITLAEYESVETGETTFAEIEA
nr:hypothetical protein [Actinomycetota bacterium]